MLIRVLVCFICFFSSVVNAGSFKVFPLKLVFDSQQKTSLFRITNTDKAPVSVQLQAAVWSQDKDGEDIYSKTSDIIFFPKIVEVNAGEERVVRVAYKGNPNKKFEQSYRLFAQELPQKSKAGGALSFALRFSVPIFVSYPRAKAFPVVEPLDVENGNLLIQVRNEGSKHLVVSNIKVAAIDGSNNEIHNFQVKGWYVLPKSQRVFSVPIDEELCLKSDKYNLDLNIGRSNIKKRLLNNSRQCAKVISSRLDQ